MKSILCFLLLTISSFNCTAQNTDAKNRTGEDSLKKYTYLIYCKDKNERITFGAGFFIRWNRKLFFVTANHLAAITACDTLDIVAGINKTYKLNAANVVKQELKTNFGEKDLLISLIDEKKIVKVNSLEMLVPNYQRFDFSRIKEIVYFGFPEVENEKQFDFKKTFPVLVRSNDTIIGSYNYFRFSKTLNKTDSINYLTKSTSESYSGEGDSGSPAFFKINGHFFFGGMCTSGVAPLKIAYIVRPEIIIKEISRYKNEILK
jgi:hypothetical protein